MNKIENRHVTKYLKDLRRKLPFPRGMQEQLTEGIQQELLDYAGDNLDFSYENLCTVFGKPSQIADVLLQENGKEHLRNRRIAYRIAYALAATILVFTVFFLVDELTSAQQIIENGPFIVIQSPATIVGE